MRGSVLRRGVKWIAVVAVGGVAFAICTSAIAPPGASAQVRDRASNGQRPSRALTASRDPGWPTYEGVDDATREALRLPMRSRVAPLTMTYWSEDAGPVVLDALEEKRLVPHLEDVRWHRWLGDESAVILDGERLRRVRTSDDDRLLADVGAAEIPPRLSPDGKWVAAAAGETVALVPTDGGRVRRAAQPGWVHSMGWHPDSTGLALSAGTHIRTLDVKFGDHTERLVPPQQVGWGDQVLPLLRIAETEWSADGEYLAYRLIYSDADDDWLTSVHVMHHRRVTDVEVWGMEPRDGLFSWSLSRRTLAVAGNFGDVDTYCRLWRPGGDSAIVHVSGTASSYRQTSWQPHGATLAAEDEYISGIDLLSIGPVASPSQISLFTIPGASGGEAREDGWPHFEWSRSGAAFCMVEDLRVVRDDAKGYRADFSLDVGDYVTVVAPISGQVVQISPVGPKIGEVQWRGEEAVTYTRAAGGGRGAFAAEVMTSPAGRDHAVRHLAEGERLDSAGKPEEAAIAFRNAVRCDPAWAEPRVRLAACYLELSASEENPACKAWLLDGAAFEIRKADSLNALSSDSRGLLDVIEATRNTVNSALGISSRRSWDRRIVPRESMDWRYSLDGSG